MVETESSTVYAYKHPSTGRVVTYTEKPAHWERLVGEKQVYTVSAPPGTGVQAIHRAAAREIKGEPQPTPTATREIIPGVTIVSGVPLGEQFKGLPEEKLRQLAGMYGVTGAAARQVLEEKYPEREAEPPVRIISKEKGPRPLFDVSGIIDLNIPQLSTGLGTRTDLGVMTGIPRVGKEHDVIRAQYKREQEFMREVLEGKPKYETYKFVKKTETAPGKGEYGKIVETKVYTVTGEPGLSSKQIKERTKKAIETGEAPGIYSVETEKVPTLAQVEAKVETPPCDLATCSFGTILGKFAEDITKPISYDPILSGMAQAVITLPAIIDPRTYVETGYAIGTGEMAEYIKTEPIKFGAGLITTLALTWGIAKVGGKVWSRIKGGPKYQVEYLRGIADVEQKVKVSVGKAGKVKMAGVDYEVAYVPTKAVRVFTTAELKKAPGLLIEKGIGFYGEKGLKAGMKIGKFEKPFAITTEVTKRFRKPPKVPEYITAYEFGKVTGKITLVSDRLKITSAARARLSVPIKDIAGKPWKVTRYVTKGKPSVRPPVFYEPKPVSAAASSRARIYGAGRGVGRGAAGAARIVETATRIDLARVVWRATRVPEAIEYISPAAAAAVGLKVPSEAQTPDLKLITGYTRTSPTVFMAQKPTVIEKKTPGIYRPVETALKVRLLTEPMIKHIPAIGVTPVSMTDVSTDVAMVVSTKAIEATKVKAEEKPISITHISPKPGPGPGILPLGWPPFGMRRRKIGIKGRKHGVRWLKHPVPEIEELLGIKLPKIRKII